MIIGVPREVKDHEYRIAVTPSGIAALAQAGHRVLVESSAGESSGFSDKELASAGAELVPDHAAVFQSSELLVKVKEPVPDEYPLLRDDLVLFAFLHLAAASELARLLIDKRITGIAFETIEKPDGTLPLLTPMSEIAGRLAIQVGAHYLEKLNGGRGVLLGGVPGVAPATVVVLGAGVVGSNAARIALGMGANVILIDRGIDRLRQLADVLHGNITLLASNEHNIVESVSRADLLIGAVLVTGAKAPHLVSRDMISTMRRGSVVVDVSIDQGGSIETCHPTTHSSPVFMVDGVLHYCVANMPGAVPRTSTEALANVTLPYVLKLANLGVDKAIRADGVLAKGVNTYRGAVCHPAVAQAIGLTYCPLQELLASTGLQQQAVHG